MAQFSLLTGEHYGPLLFPCFLMIALAYQPGFIVRYKEGFHRVNSFGRIEEVDSRNDPQTNKVTLPWKLLSVL